MSSPLDFINVRESAWWRVHFLCRWRSWRTGNGCTRVGFRWEAGGVDDAPRRDMKVKFLRRTNCGSSAILAMRKVVRGCRESECGIRYGLRLKRFAMTRTAGQAGAFKFAMCASAGIIQ